MKNKKLLLILLLIFTVTLPCFAEDMVLRTGVSIDRVPQGIYGNWRVKSRLAGTNSQTLFKQNCVDLWNLSRVGNVLTLDNPFSGAHASIIVEKVDGNVVKFQKSGDYEGKKATDTVQLNLGKDMFTGVNIMKLDTIKDGKVVKSEWARYNLSGERISGASAQ